MRHLAALVSWVVVLATAPALAQDAAGEAAVLSRVNEIRGQAGAAALVRDPALDQAALTHSTEMAGIDQLMHVSPTTGTPIDRVRNAGRDTGEVAENVAMHTDPSEAQRALEASDAHLANMLNPRFTHVGLAVVRDEAGVYVTQVFARIEVAAPPEAPAPPEPTPPEPTAPAPLAAVVAPPIAAAPIVAPEASPPAVPQPPTTAPVSAAPAGPMGSPGQVVTVAHPQGGTAGFWVCGSGRWWYYPMPAGVTSGQLQADVTVTGSPPGFGGCAPGAGGAVAVGGRVAPAPQPPGAVYTQPRVVMPGAIGPYYGAPVYAPRPQPYGAQVYGPPYGRRVIVIR